MQSAPFSWLQVTAFELIVASCVGGLSYAFCRYMEPRWNPPDFIGDIFVWIQILATCHLISTVWWDELSLIWLTIYAWLVRLGGWFHCRAGGKSKHWFAGVMVVGTACLCSFEIGMVPYSFAGFRPLMGLFGWPYMLGIFLYPVLAPLALWIYQNLRARPGIDEPLEDGAVASDT